jgi:hypothetical protein
MRAKLREDIESNGLPKPLVVFTALSLLYLVLSLVLPPNQPTLHAYHLSSSEYRILILFLNIPIQVVWFAAFYGYGKLDEYVTLVRKAAHGQPLATISTGLKFLAWGLPITSIISVILTAMANQWPGMTGFMVVTTHYLSLLVAIFAFSYMAVGSRGLADIANIRPSFNALRWVFVLFTLFGVMFTYFTITSTQKEHPNPFYMPLWLILLTIITPYLYAWFMGLFAAFEIFLYSKQTKGVLYKRALMYLASGFVITIVSSVAFQYLLVDSTHLKRISFSWLFIVIYMLLLLYATGFLLISTGAKRLKKIEEV